MEKADLKHFATGLVAGSSLLLPGVFLERSMSDSPVETHLCEDVDKVYDFRDGIQIDETKQNSARTTDEKIAELEARYGIEFEFLQTPSKSGALRFTEAIPPEQLSRKEVIETAVMEETAQALSFLPDTLIQDLRPLKIRYVTNLSSTNKSSTEPEASVLDGLYQKKNNVIYVDISTGKEKVPSIGSVFFHELLHRIDDVVMCEKGSDFYKDEAFRQGSKYYPSDKRYNGYVTSRSRPTPFREYAKPYGSKNVEEDRATVGVFTLYEQGLIAESDPEYGSPLHDKQVELVRRLERTAPGITVLLSARTVELRFIEEKTQAHRAKYGKV